MAGGFPTARSFASALEIDENRYTRYERAEVEPDLGLFNRMCLLLSVTPNDLLEMPAAAPTPVGFAEGTGPAPSPGEPATGANSKRRALAWQLAVELERLEGNADTSELAKLGRVSRIFAEIDPDPYSFVTQMATAPRLVGQDSDAADRIGVIAGKLIAALNADILGDSAGG